MDTNLAHQIIDKWFGPNHPETAQMLAMLMDVESELYHYNMANELEAQKLSHGPWDDENIATAFKLEERKNLKAKLQSLDDETLSDNLEATF